MIMVNAQACARFYTVQQGDSCNGISAAQNVSTYVQVITCIRPFIIFIYL